VSWFVESEPTRLQTVAAFAFLSVFERQRLSVGHILLQPLKSVLAAQWFVTMVYRGSVPAAVLMSAMSPKQTSPNCANITPTLQLETARRQQRWSSANCIS
jgi:hypothetical protein